MITHPKTVNPDWTDGLIVKANVDLTPSKEPTDACELFKQVQGSLQRSNLFVGGGSLRVAPDNDQLNPCFIETPLGETCGGQVCKESLGEVPLLPLLPHIVDLHRGHSLRLSH